MSRYENEIKPDWGQYGATVAEAPAETRASFIRKTYMHLLGAVLAFIALESLVFALIPYDVQIGIVNLMMGSWWSWLLVLGAFIGISTVADRMARSASGPAMQYSGLALYVVIWSILFIPILVVANHFAPAGTIGTAALVTAIIFAALTAFAFTTRADFSWMGGILFICMGAALALIVAGAIFGFSLGLWFIVPMILVASGYILFHTSALIHQYHPGQHVAASLALFSSVALLFWYVLQLIMSLQRD